MENVDKINLSAFFYVLDSFILWYNAVSNGHKSIIWDRIVSYQTLCVSYLTILFICNLHFCIEFKNSQDGD